MLIGQLMKETMDERIVFYYRPLSFRKDPMTLSQYALQTMPLIYICIKAGSFILNCFKQMWQISSHVEF